MLESVPATARRFRRSLAVALLLFFAIPGTAVLAIEQDRDLVLRNGTVLELQNLDARQRRLAFQNEQSRLRAEDRLPAAERQRRPRIPSFQGSCQVQPFGSTFLRICR